MSGETSVCDCSHTADRHVYKYHGGCLDCSCGRFAPDHSTPPASTPTAKCVKCGHGLHGSRPNGYCGAWMDDGGRCGCIATPATTTERGEPTLHAHLTEPHWQPGFGPCLCAHCTALRVSAPVAPAPEPTTPTDGIPWSDYALHHIHCATKLGVRHLCDCFGPGRLEWLLRISTEMRLASINSPAVAPAERGEGEEESLASLAAPQMACPKCACASISVPGEGDLWRDCGDSTVYQCDRCAHQFSEAEGELARLRPADASRGERERALFTAAHKLLSNAIPSESEADNWLMDTQRVEALRAALAALRSPETKDGGA